PTGFELSDELGLVQCWWKRTVVPVVVQSTTVSTGLLCWAQSQVLAHTSMTPGTPPQSKFSLMQQLSPTGTEAAACTQILPSQLVGSGFDAGELSGFTS